MAQDPEPVSGDSRGRDTCGLAPDLAGKGGQIARPLKAAPFTRGSRLGRALDGSKENIWGKKRTHMPGHFPSSVATGPPPHTGLLRPQQGATPINPQAIHPRPSTLLGHGAVGWDGQPFGQGHQAHDQRGQKQPPYSHHLLTPKSLYHHYHRRVRLLKWPKHWMAVRDTVYSGNLFLESAIYIQGTNHRGTKRIQRKVSPHLPRGRPCHRRGCP